MRIVLWNVRGLVSDEGKWKITLDFLKRVADLVFLTETHCGPETVDKLKFQLQDRKSVV